MRSSQPDTVRSRSAASQDAQDLNTPAFKTRLPDMNAARRVLIIRGSAIGDVLHATPLAAALKQSYPHLEITWITEEICGDVVTGNPFLHDVIVQPRSRWKQGRRRSPRIWAEYLGFLRELRARRYDVSIDLQGYAKSALLALAANAPYRLGWWRMRDGASLVSRPLPRLPASVHRVDWFLDVARALGASASAPAFALDIPPAARAYTDALLRAGGLDPDKPYAVLNRAAGDATRRWSETGFAHVAQSLARRYSMPSVLVGVGEDKPGNRAIQAEHQQLAQAEAAWNPDAAPIPPPLDLAGQTDLKQLFALLDRCAIQISGDTGSLHIAAALNRPVVGLFGASDPAHAGPWGQLANVVSRRDLCRPDCSLRHCAYNSAPVNKPHKNGLGDRDNDASDTTQMAHCMAAITADDVMRKVEALLE